MSSPAPPPALYEPPLYTIRRAWYVLVLSVCTRLALCSAGVSFESARVALRTLLVRGESALLTAKSLPSRWAHRAILACVLACTKTHATMYQFWAQSTDVKSGAAASPLQATPLHNATGLVGFEMSLPRCS